ncbi:MAG: glycosyltransferase [Bacteroidia bacterium]|nr:glycosyltransferase [Bacteroidia bacterium]
MAKGLLSAEKKINNNFDYILIHLVDTLPLAVKLKKRMGAKLIYDSQEYFKGQYAKYQKDMKDWVVLAESANIKEVDILLATTNVMRNRIVSEYGLKIPAFRVRNTPSLNSLKCVKQKELIVDSSKPLSLVWHGMAVYFNNTRGVHILVQAVAHCKSDVKLYLQGNINAEQKQLFNGYLDKYKLHEKIFLRPSAHPDHIVESLTEHDAGLIGELPEEDNQMLTSSNKLFDYINAGLAVVSPALPGLSETLNEFNVGLTYKTGDPVDLAACIDKLASGREVLNEFRKNSREVAKQQLYWENDYNEVWKEINS